jgi:hypothetical protein
MARCQRWPAAQGCADGNSNCADSMAAVSTLSVSRSDGVMLLEFQIVYYVVITLRFYCIMCITIALLFILPLLFY